MKFLRLLKAAMAPSTGAVAANKPQPELTGSTPESELALLRVQPPDKETPLGTYANYYVGVKLPQGSCPAEKFYFVVGIWSDDGEWLQESCLPVSSPGASTGAELAVRDESDLITRKIAKAISALPPEER